MCCDFWIPKESTVTLLQSHATLSVHLWQSPKIAPEIRYTVHRCNPTPLIYNTLIWDPQMNETQIQYETKDSREIFHIRGKGSIRQLKSNMSCLILIQLYWYPILVLGNLQHHATTPLQDHKSATPGSESTLLQRLTGGLGASSLESPEPWLQYRLPWCTPRILKTTIQTTSSSWVGTPRALACTSCRYILDIIYSMHIYDWLCRIVLYRSYTASIVYNMCVWLTNYLWRAFGSISKTFPLRSRRVFTLPMPTKHQICRFKAFQRRHGGQVLSRRRWWRHG